MARKMRRAAVSTGRSLPGGGTTRRRALEALLRERPGAPDPPRAAGTAGADPTDAAQDREQEKLWLAILDRSRGLQAKMDEAVARLAAGRYGVCAGCEAPIAVARLRALPFAVRCLPCQERMERTTGTAIRDLMAPLRGWGPFTPALSLSRLASVPPPLTAF